MRESGRRVFLAGGGTGGHLSPGLALAEALRRRRPGTAIAFSCTRRAVDQKLLGGCGYPVTPMAALPFRPAPWTWPRFLVSLVHVGNQARRRLREFCPDVVVGLGGFASYGPVRVGQKYGAGTVVLNPDIAPGRANRRLALRADLVCCQFDETVEILRERVPRMRGRAAVTGCPIRRSIVGRDRTEAAQGLGLDPSRRTLLVTGASLGARTVNRAVVSLLEAARLPEGWQVLHLTGEADYADVAAAYTRLDARGVVHAFEADMGLAYAAADLAVARAGASTIAELAAAGVPAVYMPYPFHRDEHQLRQARAAEGAGAAVVVEDVPGDPSTVGRLGEALVSLACDESRMGRMREAALGSARPDAADAVAAETLALADAVAERRHARISADVDFAARAAYTRTQDGPVRPEEEAP